MDIFYIFLKKFLYVLSDFLFSSVTILGKENLPMKGPIIVCCNHNSQFIDGALLMRLKRQINFLVAASSARLKIMTFFLGFTNFIPTERSIDKSKEAKGRLKQIKDNKLTGLDTKFSEFKPGDQLRIEGTDNCFAIKKIISDTLIETHDHVDEEFKDVKFKLIPKLDQSGVYEQVVKILMENKALGIFPEGGSHDRTELLPLKPGACIFVWESKKKLNKDVPIVPCSINYFGAHKFRSKVVINIGKPIHYQFEEDKFDDRVYKRQKIGEMVEDLKTKMTDIKLTAPNYNTLKNLYIAKEIYLPDNEIYTHEENFFILHQLTKAYKKIEDKEETKRLLKQIDYFRKELKSYSLKVSDLRTYNQTFGLGFKRLIIKTFLITFYLFPFIFYFVQLSFIVKKKIMKIRDRCLKKSFVKVKANDVVTTQSVMYALKIMPFFFTFYSILFFIFIKFYLDLNTLLCIRLSIDFLCFFPIYMYLSVKIYDNYTYNMRMIFFRLKMYFLYKDFYKAKIENLAKKRYEIKEQLLHLLENSDELEEIKSKRIVNESVDDYKYQQDKVKQIVKSISENFINIVQFNFFNLIFNYYLIKINNIVLQIFVYFQYFQIFYFIWQQYFKKYFK